MKLIIQSNLILILTITTIASLGYFISWNTDQNLLMKMANGIMPALIGAACALTAYRIVDKDKMGIWNPLSWFFIGWAIYYGFGPLVYLFGSKESVAYMDATYFVDERSLLRTNILNLVGLISVILGWLLFFFTRQRSKLSGNNFRNDPLQVALIFLMIGVPIRYFFDLPYSIGLTDYVLPGSIKYLGTFVGLAIIPLSIASARQKLYVKSLLWIVIILENGVGIIMLSKLEIIKTFLLWQLGQHLIYPRIKHMVIASIMFLMVYSIVLTPFVNFGRILWGRPSTQGISEAGISIRTYYREGRETLIQILPGVQSWWTRLCYSNVQAFVMDQFDNNLAGSTFKLAAYALIPRIFYEEKPIMTSGVEFTRIIAGHESSSTGIGFFAEAYWNGGWLLVLITGIYVGVLFRILNYFSVKSLLKSNWLYLPLIFQGIYIAFRLDDWFVPTYLGGPLTALFASFALIMVSTCLSKIVPRYRSKFIKPIRMN